ncbi:hypothetical protein BDZ45DRAFT_311757 [Acephala macrosclerotiorum]|nr:hypothetical protein BDZ45DRAFT_311757 [Acephala macrosclerotiorum]
MVALGFNERNRSIRAAQWWLVASSWHCLHINRVRPFSCSLGLSACIACPHYCSSQPVAVRICVSKVEDKIPSGRLDVASPCSRLQCRKHACPVCLAEASGLISRAFPQRSQECLEDITNKPPQANIVHIVFGDT